MTHKPTRIIAFLVALTFGCGLPVFAGQEQSQSSSAPSNTHMAADEAKTPKAEPLKQKKTKKKKLMDKKAKKAHKKTGDES